MSSRSRHSSSLAGGARGEPSDRQRRSKPSPAHETRDETGDEAAAAAPPKTCGRIAGLVIVATPIGNAADISARALGALARADVVACEDTRVTSKLFAVHGIRVPMLPYHEHNAAAQRPKLIGRLKGGESVALVSDAGMPLISDPGYRLVGECVDAGIAVTCVPGPSAVTTALALSGLPTDRFFFQGFLPAKAVARQGALEALAAIPGSLVILESANRLAAMLADAANVLGARQAAVTRELTKRFEEVRRGPLAELAGHYAVAGAPKGEITVVIGPATEDRRELDDGEIDTMLKAELEVSSLRDTAAKISRLTGRPRREIYARALELARDNR